MKSPFPGIDPFIEGCGLWEDFHHHLVEKTYEYLAERLPERYVARTGERSYLVLSGPQEGKNYAFKPDVALTSDQTAPQQKRALAVAEPQTDGSPLRMRAFLTEEFREAFVEIREAAGAESLVTCIEILSPANKKPDSKGWKLYLRKRRSLLMGLAHFVEMDLLRGGRRMPMLDPWPSSPYTLLVARSAIAPVCHVWPAYALQRLPAIPVPLLAPDADIILELQPLIEAIYHTARYGRSIDYSKSLKPPLSEEEGRWLREHLPSA